MTDHLVPPELLAIMQCPVDGGRLEEDHTDGVLVCQTCGRTYPVDEHGIPDMVVDDAPPG